jgi:hypothetical protein
MPLKRMLDDNRTFDMLIPRGKLLFVVRLTALAVGDIR